MSTESEHDVLRQIEDLRTTRERLGKPVFPDQKLAYKITVRSVAETVDNAIEDLRVPIQAYMYNVVDSCRKEGVTITPATITIETYLSMVRDIQRIVLLGVAFHERGQSAKVAAAAQLDVVKGFMKVIAALSEAYNPIFDESVLLGVGINVGLVKKDPKGFLFVEDQVKFWSSPLRISDAHIESYEDPKLIAAGAELGAKTYKRMYPIAEKVLSQNN